MTETLELQSKGESDRQPSVAYTSTARAEFVHPLLAFAPRELSFVHMHSPALDAPDATGQLPSLQQTQLLQMTNVSLLPLDYTLRASPPFSLDAYEFRLAASESRAVTVLFDPMYKEDKQSHAADTRITAVYKDHPRRDTVRCAADINFPNVKLDVASVSFGAVLNDTTSSQVVRISNVSKLPVHLSWAFVEDPDEAAAEAAAAGVPYIPVNQIFDIMPIRCLLLPGQEQAVEVVYYAHAGRKAAATAVCEVAGGPEYTLALAGESAVAGFRVDKQMLDFGRMPYSGGDSRDFTIHNTGKVPYMFVIEADPALMRPGGGLVLSTKAGRVAPGEKVRVDVRLRPGVPGPVAANIVVTVAHFQPITIAVAAEAVFGSVACELPIDDEDDVEWRSAYSLAGATVRARRSAAASAIAALEAELASEGVRAPSAAASASAAALAVGKTPAGLPVVATAALPSAAKAPAPPSTTRSRPMSAARGVPSASLSALPLDIDVQGEAMRVLFAAHVAIGVAARKQGGSSARQGTAPHTAPLQSVVRAGPPEAFPKAPEEGLKAEGSGSSDGMPDVAVPADVAALLPLAVQAEPSLTNRAKSPPGRPATTRAGTAAPTQLPPMLRCRAPPVPGAGVEDFHIARYTIDLGNIILGATKTKTFNVWNTGGMPVSVQWDRTDTVFQVFTLEPTRIPKVAEAQVRLISAWSPALLRTPRVLLSALPPPSERRRDGGAHRRGPPLLGRAPGPHAGRRPAPRPVWPVPRGRHPRQHHGARRPHSARRPRLRRRSARPGADDELPAPQRDARCRAVVGRPAAAAADEQPDAQDSRPRRLPRRARRRLARARRALHRLGDVHADGAAAVHVAARPAHRAEPQATLCGRTRGGRGRQPLLHCPQDRARAGDGPRRHRHRVPDGVDGGRPRACEPHRARPAAPRRAPEHTHRHGDEHVRRAHRGLLRGLRPAGEARGARARGHRAGRL